MTRPGRKYAFIDFDVRDEAALGRLSRVLDEFRLQKAGDAIADEAHWLPYFEDADRAEFWWPDAAELERWNRFWFSTPLPERHSPKMPSPAWAFGSMIDAILDGEYQIVGLRGMATGQARLEFDPHTYPYGGTGGLRALIRAFGHQIIGFDDGTGFTAGDAVSPRWTPNMLPPKPKRPSFWSRFSRA